MYIASIGTELPDEAGRKWEPIGYINQVRDGFILLIYAFRFGAFCAKPFRKVTDPPFNEGNIWKKVAKTWINCGMISSSDDHRGVMYFGRLDVLPLKPVDDSCLMGLKIMTIEEMEEVREQETNTPTDKAEA